MTTIKINPGKLNKWIHQNKAEYTGAFFEGSLLDNFMLACKRGYAAVYERYVNPNQSDYIIYFVPYSDAGTLLYDRLWSEFYARQGQAEQQAEELNRLAAV